MRTKVTLVLLFLNVALFFFIFHFERDWRTERAALEVRRRVLGPEASDIRSITVEHAFRLERRSADSWFLTEPLEWPANFQAVTRIVNDLQLLDHETSFSVRNVIKNGLSLATYGLDHPRLVVTLTSGGADTTGSAPITTVLRFGDTAKSGGQLVYLLSPDGEQIHVVRRELVDSLSLPLEQLRSDAILTVPVFEASSLNLQATAPATAGSASSPGPRVRLRYERDSKRWQFEAPIPDARADKNATELAINGLDALRVKSFVTDVPSGPLPSAAPALRVAIEGNGRHETLFVGAPAAPAREGEDREYYAQLEDRPALFTVVIPSTLMDALGNAQEALRDRHVLDFDPSAVTAITLASPSEKQPEITLQRLEAPAGGGWQIVLGRNGAAGPQRADLAAVQALLNQLSLLTAVAFQSDAPQAADLETWGFNLPEREITLSVAPSGATPTASLLLQIGVPTPRDDRAFARVANAPSVYAVAPDILDETPMAPLAWRDKLLRDLPAGAAITGLRLTDLLTQKPVLAWRADTGLAPGAAPAPAGSEAALHELQAQLRTLRARRFLQDAFSDSIKDERGETRRWRYRLEMDYTLPAGAGGGESHTSALWFTERTAGSQQYAGSIEFKAVFAIEQPLLDALWTLTYGARDPGPAPATPPVAAR